jgi:hypothetical protein
MTLYFCIPPLKELFTSNTGIVTGETTLLQKTPKKEISCEYKNFDYVTGTSPCILNYMTLLIINLYGAIIL